MPDNTAFCVSLSSTPESMLRTPRACNVPVREHQASGARRESEPVVSCLGSVFARWRKSVRIRSNCARKMANTDGANPSVALVKHSTDAFACAWTRRRHDEPHCSMVFAKPGRFGHHVLLRARIWHVLHGKRRRGPRWKIG